MKFAKLKSKKQADSIQEQKCRLKTYDLEFSNRKLELSSSITLFYGAIDDVHGDDIWLRTNQLTNVQRLTGTGPLTCV